MGDGTSLGRVRGLGSAKEGAHHWWHQRLTAGANLLLVLWFLASLLLLPGYDYATLSLWLSSAWNAVPMLLLVTSVLYHARLGLQVAIEDYQHGASRLALLVLIDFFVAGAAALAIFSILKVALAPVTGASA